MTDNQAEWRRRISEQETSGQTVRNWCRKHNIGEHSFYVWRKRLEESRPVRFARIQPVTRNVAPAADTSAVLELQLPGGERLRIASGVDRETLRVVLEALRP